MRKNWVGTIVLVGVSMATGVVLSQMWEPAHGQPGGFSAEEVPQVIVKQPAELPKWCVDFMSLSPQVRVITVVDTETKKIAVYHEETATGGVKLLSVRNIQPDLMLDSYNALTPLPSQLIQEQQRLKEANR